MKILEWSRRYNGLGADEYPELFEIEANSLSSAIEVAVDFPVGKKKSLSENYNAAFEKGKTFQPEKGVVFNTSVQIAAFILISETETVGGKKRREAIFLIKRKNEGVWIVQCIKTVTNNALGPFQLSLKRIGNNAVSYVYSGNFLEYKF